MSVPAVKAASNPVPVQQTKKEGTLNSKPVEKIDPQVTYTLKPIVKRIIAVALLALSFTAVVLGISLLASATVSILGLSVTATRVVGAVMAIFGCAGILRGISLFESSFIKKLEVVEESKDPLRGK